MAKQPSELNRKVVQHLRTTKTDEQIVAIPLEDVMAQGEIAVQLGTGNSASEKKKRTGIWTLAADGETPVRFASQELLEDMLSKIVLANADGSINVVTGATPDVNVNIKSGEKVLAKDGGNGVYTNIKISAVTPSSTNVKEEYALYATDGSVLGDNIKIYKDSSLYGAYLGHVDDALVSNTGTTVTPGTGDTALCFIYQKVDGTYELVAVNVEDFLQESEFKDGLQVVNHEVSVKVDNTSEAFLTVGSNGLKLSGVQNAINTAINALNAEISGKSSDNHVTVKVDEVSGKVTTVIVTTNDIASDSALTELSAATKAIEENLDIEVVRAQSAETMLAEELAAEVQARESADTELAQAIASSRLNIVDDNKYIETNLTVSGTGTTVGVSAITKSITSSTSASTALADSYNVRTFAVNDIIAGNTGIVVVPNNATGNTDGVRKIDFTGLIIDCGIF